MSKLNIYLMLAITMIAGCNQAPTNGQPLRNDLIETKLESLAEDIPELETELAINSNTPAPGKAFLLDCILFQLPPNFFENFGYALPQPVNGAIILTDFETPFVTSRRRPRPKPVYFEPNQPKRLSDTFFTKKYDEYWVEITGSQTGEKIHLRISSSNDSKLRLESDISADISINGSVIIKSSNPISGEYTEFLQIIGRAHK